jgi:hypothetical protein
VSTEQFIASLVQSLAWPAALVLVAVVFRVQLRRLLTGQLRRLKAGPIEAEFDRLISHVRTELPLVQAVPGAVAVSDELSDLVRTSPRAAILEAHERIEALLRDALEQAGELEGLAVMRNLAAHEVSGEVTPEGATRYLVLADSVLFALRANLRRPRPADAAASA